MISSSTANAAGAGTSADLETMFKRMEADTLGWAKHMEELILPSNKCSATTISKCAESNYNGCISEMPYATCPGAEHRILACGKGNEGGCSGLFDFTATKVSLAKGDLFNSISRPSEREKDGVCYTLPGDEFIKTARTQSTDYWNQYQVSPPWYHYGNDDGVFRMLPGSPEECATGASAFDPRIRPWYVAASSGPKDVLLILDTSGSMGNYGRLSIMKDAAKRVISTLGVSDFFSIIEFNSVARHVGGSQNSGDSNAGLMQRANDENKQKALGAISGLGANGSTNFYNGFDMAFKTFKASKAAELTSGCHKAILFLTDGIMGDSKVDLMNLIKDELSEYNTASASSPPALFTYSFGSGADSEVPKEIACQHDGIWASIKDGGDLSQSMGAYYKYFAYGLSGDENKEFVAWVAPYEYSTTGELGTTASAPVYDRSVDPAVLAGVVGLDFSFAAMARALGEEGEQSKNVVLERIVERSIATCPKLELSPCQLQSLREFGATDTSNTGSLCSGVTDDNGLACNTTPLKSPLCSNGLLYPLEIWNNANNKGRSYEEKVCCNVGDEPRKANTLSFEEVKGLVCVEKSNVGMIVGATIGGVVGLCLLVCVVCYITKSRRKGSNAPYSRTPNNNTSVLNNGNVFPIEADIVVMPPPTAPDYK